MKLLILILMFLAPLGGQITGGTSAQTSAKPIIQAVGQNPAGPAAAVPQGAQTPAPKAPQADKNKLPMDDSGIIVQTRGPLHEAFAQPVDQNPTPTTVVPKAPPPAVPELPPAEKPDGANVQWIPGYWGWDPEKKDYLWVSGIWRNAPPDRKWTSGYWNKAGNGWQWTTGFWADGKQAKPKYQPEPPDSLDQGPSQPAPNENYFYIPGAWVQQDGRYVWRPGFWYPAQQNWVYVAPHYSYTPAGVVYVDGYWDYPFADRGTVYAPVVFNQPYWNNPDWYYQPNYALDFGQGGPWDNLFVGSGYGPYYFGDFFAPFYFRHGFRPWYAYGARNYDPLFAYNHWANRFNSGWYNGLHNTFWARVNDPNLRSPTTLGQTRALAAHGGLMPGAIVPRSVATAAGSGTGNPAQLAAARQLQQPAALRAESEKAVASTMSSSPRPAGGPSMISSASTISGGSARVFNSGPALTSMSRGAVASSAFNQPTFNANSRAMSSAAASSSLTSRGPISYQSFYAGPSRTAPTPLFQAHGRPEEGQNLFEGTMRASQAMMNGRAYSQAFGQGGSISSRSGISGYAPSSSFSGRSMGAPSGGMHMGGGGGGHAGGGGHGGGGGGGHH
ncbi:MAG TPA: hypothetical protein VGP68_05280 [Gemmataceae bacterium]|jgi:hypothetical protein|nr:hypothetical protein [Gemmataceae bacterium]